MTLSVCAHCLCVKGKGISHVCSPQTKLNNLKKIISESDTLCGEHIAAHVLKQKSTKEESKTLKVSQEKGKPLRVELFPNKSPSTPSLTLDQVLTIQHNLNFGSNTTLKLAKELRYGFRKRKCIAPGLKNAIVQNNKFVDDMFLHTNQEFFSKDTLQTEQVIFCNDVKAMIETCIEKRELQFSKLRFKIGIDGGGGFLKICQNIILDTEEGEVTTPKKRRLYTDGTEGDAHRDTSIYKLHILALVPDIPENYFNVAKLWNLLDLEPLEDYGDIKVAADLKLCNIMLGLQSHASNHPCSWCDIDK